MIKHSMNAHIFDKRYEKNRKPSLTIPDQTMSIREILVRFSRGLSIDGVKTPIYDEENDLPDFRTLDLAERQELAEIYKNEIKYIKNSYNKVDKQDELKDNERVLEKESISGEPKDDL